MKELPKRIQVCTRQLEGGTYCLNPLSKLYGQGYRCFRCGNDKPGAWYQKPIVVTEGVARIPLTRGKYALVDEVDLSLIGDDEWYASPRGDKWYAMGRDKQYLHRILMNPPKDMQVDHINGDGLDCRRDNMRLATASQNCANSAKKYPNGSATSDYRGVHRWKTYWKAQVVINRKRHAKYGKTEREAAQLYNEMAKQYFGEYAKLNEIPSDA